MMDEHQRLLDCGLFRDRGACSRSSAIGAAVESTAAEDLSGRPAGGPKTCPGAGRRELSLDVVHGRVQAIRTVVRPYLMTSSSTPHVSSEGTAKHVEQTLRPGK
jgi:hypothetical protein